MFKTVLTKGIVKMHSFITRDSDLKELQEIIGYQFIDINLLKRALTRQTAVQEQIQAKERGSFQRLEFIGDKILNLTVSQILYDYHPDWQERQLSNETARFVNNKDALTNIARKWQIGKHLIVGRGEEISHIRENAKALADAVEALLGAIFQDSNNNFQLLKNLIKKHWSTIGLVASQNVATIQNNIPDFTDHFNDIISCEDKNEKINKIKFLMKNGICKDEIQSIFEVSFFDISILQVICSFNIDQELLDNWLIESVRSCLPEQVDLLLRYGANPNYIQKTRDDCDLGETSIVSDPYTISVLQRAVESCYSDESMHIIKSLLNANADPNWQDAVYWSSRSLKRNINTDKLLNISTNNAKPNIEEIRKKESALHIVVKGDSPYKEELIILLIRHKANPNLVDYEGKTPLHVAANDYYMEFKRNIFYLLIRHGADPQQKNINNETPEQCCQKAVAYWHESTKRMIEYSNASMLLFHGANKLTLASTTTKSTNTTVLAPPNDNKHSC